MAAIERLVTGRCLNNCYIMSIGDDVAIIDPGDNAKKVIEAVSAKSESPEVTIFLTHGHVDQIACVPELIEKYPKASVCVGRAENLFLFDSGVNLSRHMGKDVNFTSISAHIRSVLTDDTIKVGSLEIRIAETPGHTPGSVMYVCDKEKIAFCGDTILREGIGGTDFPFGDEKKLISSIRDRILILPGHFKLYPAHGDATTVGHESENNPFIVAMGK